MPDAARRYRPHRRSETSSWRASQPAESTASRPSTPQSAARWENFAILWSTLRDIVLRIFGKMQVLPHALEIAANLVQTTDADRCAQRFLQRLQWIAAVRAGI